MRFVVSAQESNPAYLIPYALHPIHVRTHLVCVCICCALLRIRRHRERSPFHITQLWASHGAYSGAHAAVRSFSASLNWQDWPLIRRRVGRWMSGDDALLATCPMACSSCMKERGAATVLRDDSGDDRPHHASPRRAEPYRMPINGVSGLLAPCLNKPENSGA